MGKKWRYGDTAQSKKGIVMAFNEKKVTQMAAFFLQERDKKMPHLKLMKLLYLAERESLSRYGFPMSGDRLVSMPHGPVLSNTLDRINGWPRSEDGYWRNCISDRENYEVSLNVDCSLDDFDELSPADIEILNDIQSRYGYKDQWELVKYTHRHLPEWTDQQGSSIPITYQSIFEALGYSTNEAQTLADRIDEEDTIDRLFE